MNKSEIQLAEKLFDSVENEELTKYLEPFVEQKNPIAINFISSFSQPGESPSEFNKRYIKQKIEASDLGCADASYRMGVNHLYGDDVERDLNKASLYFERAIKQGH
jgi:TPR repeat protein